MLFEVAKVNKVDITRRQMDEMEFDVELFEKTGVKTETAGSENKLDLN